MKRELSGIGLYVLVLLVIFSSGCVLRSSNGTEDEVEGISVSFWGDWEEDDLYMGMKIRIIFMNDAGDSVKVIDKVNVKIIYEKDTSKEDKVYDKEVEIKESSYEYAPMLGAFCVLKISYLDFFKDNGNYIAVVEYNGMSGIDNDEQYIVLNPEIIDVELISKIWIVGDGWYYADADVGMDINIKDVGQTNPYVINMKFTEPCKLSIYLKNQSVENEMVFSKDIFRDSFNSIPAVKLQFTDFVKGNGDYTFNVSYKDKSNITTKHIAFYVDKIDVNVSEYGSNDLEVKINSKDYADYDVKITGNVNVSIYNESDELTHSEIVSFSDDNEEIIYIDESDYYTGEGDYTVTVKYENIVGEDTVYIEE